ncbi:TetR/AcrR family transcriptional regulator [Ligilactobacillus hayakitensis]|nr:TetR/AcrR family transcriptional regulator [Ligilactobacillus hayakitensis]
MKSKDKIMYALLDLAQDYEFSQITNEMIIQTSNVSRGTYYKYFNIKEDILVYIESNFDSRIFNLVSQHTVEDYKTPFHFLGNIVFPALYERRDMLRILYSSSLRAHWMAYLEEVYTNWSEKFFADYKEVKTIPHYYAHRGVVKITLDLIGLWMSQEKPERPEEFSTIYLRMIHTPMIDLLPDSQKNLIGEQE